MTATEAYAALSNIGSPVLGTDQAAAVLGASSPATVKTLDRLAQAGLARRLRHGVWHIGPGVVNPRDVLVTLCRPYPVYVSGWSALFHHQMIEQIPAAICAVSLGPTRKAETTDLNRYRISHIHPALWGGFDAASSTRAGMARPEKALFDTIYGLSARSGDFSLPELELPGGFDRRVLEGWVSHIPSTRLAAITSAHIRSALPR